MNRFTRGSTILFEAETFLDASGAAITPTTVTLYITYPSSPGASYGSSTRGAPGTTDVDYAMTDSSGVWSYEWDSSVAYPGTVYFSINAAGSDVVVKDGAFQLQANPANPDP